MNVQQAITKHVGRPEAVTHVDPVILENWVNVLAPDTLLKPAPWTQPTSLWEVFTESCVFFNNREHTEYFLVVERAWTWLCHYDNDNAVTTVVARVDGL